MVLTEEKLRALYKKEKIKELSLDKGTIITPSAQQFLNQMSIKIFKGIEKKEPTLINECKEVVKNKEWKYIGITGEVYFNKPEYMTVIKENIIVKKNNKRIILRGKLESLEGKFLLIVNVLKEKRNSKLNSDLCSIESFIKKLIISEKTNENLEELNLLGENFNEIKNIFNDHKKYFKMENSLEISSKSKRIILELNEIRCLVREIEIVAVNTLLKDEGEIEREDIIKSINILSSAIYIMMVKGEKGIYGD